MSAQTAPATISCNAALFKAALTFAGNKDARYYLNGVRIEPSPDGVGVRIIATDGHRLAVLFDPDGHATAPAIVERHKVPAIPKAMASDAVTFNGDFATYPGGVSFPVHYIDDTFPDWQVVIPMESTLSGCAGAFNPEYLADCAVIPKAYGCVKYPSMQVAQRDAGSSALVTFGDSVPAFAVIMPLRDAMPSTFLPDFMAAGRASRMAETAAKTAAKLAAARDLYRDAPRDATLRALVKAGNAWRAAVRACKDRGIATVSPIPFPPDRAAWHPADAANDPDPIPPVPPAVVSIPPVVRSNPALDALRRAVTGAIESGTGVAVVETPAFDTDRFGRYAVADPAARVPAALLTPDGRYSCDGCEAATERASLTALATGYYCPDCAPGLVAELTRHDSKPEPADDPDPAGIEPVSNPQPSTGIEPVSPEPRDHEPVSMDATGIEPEPVSTGIEDQPVSEPATGIEPVSNPEPATGIDPMAALIAHQLRDENPRDLAPVFSHARYSKQSYAVRCPSSDGYKTRAARLAEALRGRNSNRERAYIMPRSKALKLARLWSNGWDACVITGKLDEPRANVTRIEPYREAKQRQRARWNPEAGTWQPVSAAA